MEFGMVCRELAVCGGFADGRNKAYGSLLGWVGVENVGNCRIVYVDVATDRKYLYDGDVDSLTAQDVANFMKRVEAGEIDAIGTTPKQAPE